MVIIRKRRKNMPAALLFCEVILLICILCGCAALPGNKTSDTEENVVPDESTIDETVTDGGGAIEFHPSLSMENGHIPGITGVYDFSIYEKLPDEQPVQNAEEILMKVDEVKTAIEQGMKIMYTGDTQLIEGNTCMVFALGTDRDEQFVREYYYGVCGNLVYVYDAIDDIWKIVI